MSAGWIAQGPDTPLPATAQVDDPWKPIAPDSPSTPALVRPHQDPDAHPVDNTRGLFSRAKDLLFGHEPDSATDPDQHYAAGILPAVGTAVDNEVDAVKNWATGGPSVGTLASAYPHLLGAQFGSLKAGIQEKVGASQVQGAERQLAALNVLPQVADRVFGPGNTLQTMPSGEVDAKIAEMAKDPLVDKTARKLGISPQDFANDWQRYAGVNQERLADQAASAQQTLTQGQATRDAGTAGRNQAWADDRAWQPADLAGGKLDPWSLKGMAFDTALAIPQMAAVAGATAAGGAVAGPVGAVAAGGATATALMAPGQRADIKNKVDDQVNRLLQKADALDDVAPIGGRRGLNPVTEQLRQQAADLAASSDRIADTGAFFYGLSDVVGAVPVSSVLSRSPLGKAMLDRMVGSAMSQTVGGRIAGSMVANGVGGMVQTAIQKAVDAGIVHEDTPLKDALLDIVHSGVTTATTAGVVHGITEAAEAPGRAQAKRDLDADELLNRVRTAADAMSRPQAGPGETYPGYRWNDATGQYEPTAANAAANATKPRISGTVGPSAETNPPHPATNGPSGETPAASGAAGARQAYQTKVDALNTAAAAAEKRSDVSLQPEEEGWSVHVKGQQVATFDTVEAAREAVAQARKLVGTKPASTAEVSPDTNSAPIGTHSQDETVPLDKTGIQPDREPETDLERTQPVQSERRSDTGLRARVADMNPEQLRAALLTHELTGMPNRRAYEDSDKLPVQVSADSDSLKAINDFGGHQAGDQALKAVAAAMQAEAPDRTYHLSGDEFTAQANSEDEAHDLMGRVNQRLANAVVEVTMPDGKIFHLKGLGVSYGVGKDLNEADGNLQGSKTQREAEGLRAPRGVLPPGATIGPREAGGQGNRGQVAGEPGEVKGLGAGGGGTAEVLGQTVKRPAVPTAEQRANGNYFKPTVKWHGLPISVENVSGQVRKGIGSDGKPFSRKMKAAYGDFAGTKGADGDGVDVMMGPHHDAPHAYVIDQLDPTGKTFDETKTILGVRSEQEARDLYLSHYPEKWKGLGGVTTLEPAQLKRWLKEGDHSRPIDPQSVPAGKVERQLGPDAKHDSILQYLARHPRGLDREEAESQGIDKADMALSPAHVGIKRAFRRAGMSFDHAAETLAQEGYPVTDDHGHYSPNVLLDRISDELRGQKHYSVHNEAHLPEHGRDWRQPLTDRELDKLSLEQTRNRLAELQVEQERLEREIERAGMNEDSEHETEEELDRIPFQRSTRPPGMQMDLFGAVNHVKNEIKKVEAALDAKRNEGQESIETGKPDDLFSQARKQTDLTDKPTIPPSVKGGPLEDAGEKIGGARKDRWTERGMRLSDMDSMTEGEAAELVNKKAVWNPDWQKLIASGKDPKTAALSKLLFDQLAARPRMNTPTGRRHYVEVLGRVRDMLMEAKTPDDLKGLQLRLANELGMPTGYAIASTPEQKLARDKFWSIQKGRRASLSVAYSDIRKADEMLAKGWPEKAIKAPTDAVKPKNDKELPVRPHLDHIDRVGPPVRRGDIASQDFVKDFGFRGLEFGNWAASDERQRLLNYAYEGLHDLARALNLPPQALSLNGTLGLALGARGSGRAAAHYESSKLVINMTKTSGAGALAHEWGHALDHYMGELGRPDAYTVGPRGATGWRGDRRSLGHLRPELQEAWNGVMEAMYKKQQPAAEFIRDHELRLERLKAQRDAEQDPVRKEWYAKQAEVDERSLAELRSDQRTSYSAGPSAYIRESSRLGDYWRRPTEMFARAFEGFVQDKIAAEGNKSEYLVHHAAGLGYPGEDRPQVNAAIQKLVDTFEAKGDKSALFQRTESPAEGWGQVFHRLPATMSAPEIHAHVNQMLQGFSVKPEVVVARDLAELKRDPALSTSLKDAEDGDVIAFVHGGKIYLVANQFHGPSDVSSAIAHEYITHYGLRAAFGNRGLRQYQAILNGVAAAMPAELRTRGEREFPGGFNPLNAHQRNVAAEEVLAYYGQRYAADQSVPSQLKRWFDKLHAMIRDWIRNVMGLPKKFDELFVKRTLADLESFLRSGHTAEQDATRQGSTASATRAGPAFAGHEDTFFSGLAKAVDAAKREKGTGAEWEATLRNMAGVKQEEMTWVGLKDWLEGRGRVTKAEVADYVAAHRVQLGEVEKGGVNNDQPSLSTDDLDKISAWMQGRGLEPFEPNGEEEQALLRGGPKAADVIENLHRYGFPMADLPVAAGNEPTKFHEYTTPGGSNYRELLMTLPHSSVARPDMLTQLPEGYELIRDESMPPSSQWGITPPGQSHAMPFAGRHPTTMRAWAAALAAVNEQRMSAWREQQKSASFQSPHWDEPNVLAHIRFDDRTGPQGERVLHLAELQSDWHQQGRRIGYEPTLQQKAKLDARRKVLEAFGRDATSEQKQEWARIMNELQPENGARPPAAPFKTTWPELAMKRILRYGSAHGYDAVSWDTGDTNAERYDLSKHIESVEATKYVRGENAEDRDYHLKVIGKDGRIYHNGSFMENRLADYIGKDLAEKIINQPPGKPSVKYEGLDLKVGGEGMRKFYDQMLPAMVGKLVKKWGAGVEPGTVRGGQGMRYDVVSWGNNADLSRVIDTISDDAERQFVTPPISHDAAEEKAAELNQAPSIPVHSVLITPRMRDSVLGGQPMFQRREELERARAANKAARESGERPEYADPLTRPDETVAMFLKRRKGSVGTAPPAPKKGAYEMARRAVAAIPNSELMMSFRRILDPAGVSPPARATALVTREALGELAQSSEEALKTLEEYSKTFDLLAPQDRYDFIHSMETGAPQANKALQPAADTIRELLDGWREKIRGLGTGALDNFIENYFPHIWADDAKAKKVFGQIFGRRPLKGPASFLKERTIPTTKEGLEAGLKPISSNPLILAFAKLREMQRFYTGVKLMQRFKDEGLAKFLPAGKMRPDDWAEINDAVGRVRQWSETEQGFIERGHYIMPVDAARVINNHLGASALRNFLPAQVFRVMSNAANALQLGFSAFHLGFTTLDAVISKNALAIERMAHGEPLKAARALLEGATGVGGGFLSTGTGAVGAAIGTAVGGPIGGAIGAVVGGAAANMARGYRLMKAYSNIGGATPEMRRIVEGLMAGGGRVKMDNYYQAAQGLSPFKGVGFASLAHDVKMALTQPAGKVWAATQVLGSFPLEYATRLWRDMQEIWRLEPLKILPIMSAMEIAGRMTRASTSIIMEHIVPLQKLGVFSDLAADHIRRNPLEDPVAFAGAMQRIWNSVDNRLGEMVYDNVFWNRTFKEVNHMMVRAVGWNLGTIRELGGAPIDVVKVLDYVARGAPAEGESPDLSKTSQARQDYEEQKSKLQRIAEKVGHKIPYTLALIGSTMILGAIITRLFTGKDPEETKDYFFPWTGRMTKYGTKERISMPSYTKDLYEYGTQPMTTLINKANPLFGIIHSIYANEDFFGNPVRHSDYPLWKQILEGAQYAQREVMPFSLQGTKQFVGAGEMDTKGKVLSTMPYVGFGPAPARVTSPDQMERYQLREEEKGRIRGLQMKLKQAQAKGDQAEIEQLRDDLREAKLRERGTERDIRQDKAKAAAAADKISSLIRGRSREDAAVALDNAGLPAFAALWRSLPDQPRPRVVESLEHYA
jgi:GGDEF domain-containing protein